jgi:hypothetical protein
MPWCPKVGRTSVRPTCWGAALVFFFAAVVGAAQPATPHAFLERLCDDFGPRMTGSVGNAAAMERLAETLRGLGYAPEKVPFTMPGWERGDDRVEVVAPFARRLRVASLSYTQSHGAFEADVVDLGNAKVADLDKMETRGRIGVLSPTTALQTSEIVTMAVARGLRAVLFVNREGGGQLLARTGSFSGTPLPLPIFSIAQEEGQWLQRLLARGTAVRVRMETKSRCREVATANLHLVVPGRMASRLIVGAHLDSWDLGQGAMDNGIGIAQLYALALALRGATPHHTVELVWLNGEEQGLRGSRFAAAQLGTTPVVAMINLDMVGVPIGVNALGDDSLVPALERWHGARPESARLAKGVENLNWVASDHTPYQLAGVRALTFNGPILRESVRYYHDFADTIDKVPAKLIEDSSAVVVSCVRALAEDRELKAERRSAEETEKLFTRFGLEKRMRAMGLWGK